jgi:hypothetical protein
LPAFEARSRGGALNNSRYSTSMAKFLFQKP